MGSGDHYPWLSDHPEPEFLLGDYTALKRNYLPEDYRLDAHGLNVVATVHIEAECDRARSVDETAWLHRIHEQHGMPNAVVAHAVLHAADLEAKLIAHTKFRWCAASARSLRPTVPAACRTRTGAAA